MSKKHTRGTLENVHFYEDLLEEAEETFTYLKSKLSEAEINMDVEKELVTRGWSIGKFNSYRWKLLHINSPSVQKHLEQVTGAEKAAKIVKLIESDDYEAQILGCTMGLPLLKKRIKNLTNAVASAKNIYYVMKIARRRHLDNMKAVKSSKIRQREHNFKKFFNTQHIHKRK